MTTDSRIISYFFLFTSLIGVQCKSTRSLASQKKMYKTIYIDQFRLTYFRQLLIKSYNNSNAIRQIVKSDHSGFTEPILTIYDYNLIDSLTTADNQKMQIDSARSIG